MNGIRRTPLEPWIAARIGLPEGTALTRGGIEAYQLGKLREVLSHVRSASPHYRDLLAGFPELPDFDDFSRFPFTFPGDVRKQGLRMLSVSQDEVARVVTLSTSGTTGDEKRVYFTEDDLELTVDFFMHGMTTLVGPGDVVIIFLPGERPYSVGDLLSKGLVRMGVKPVVHGPVYDRRAAVEEIMKYPSCSLIGIPSQILSVARSDPTHPIPKGWVRSVLLSTDYVPRSIVGALRDLWGCTVFSHYGMTETGLGGGVECEALAGYHLREADLFFEIVDPATGAPLEDGMAGEVVVTTLTRQGMPLIRYRTGDIARILPDPCPCGTALKRMEQVRGRVNGAVALRGDMGLSLPALDEALFPIEGVLNYAAEVADGEDGPELRLSFFAAEGTKPDVISKKVVNALTEDPIIHPLLDSGALALGAVTLSHEDWSTTGVRKRKLVDSRRPPQT